MSAGQIFWNGEGQISPHQLYDYFNSEGIGKYFFDEEKKKSTEPILVKITDNVVSSVSVGYLLEMTKDYILNCTAETGNSGPILDSLHSRTSLFGDRNLKLLKTLALDFISDTPECGYFFFRNGVVQVFANEITLKPYSDFDQHVWESSIIPMDFTPVNHEELLKSSDFMKFLFDLSVTENSEQSSGRFISLASAVGYLIHRHKDPATTKAIILMDVYVNGQPNGGSGKTLLINSVGKVRKLSTIDGKKYDQREWFALSSVDLDSGVLLFDDVEKNFNLEQIFPLMTTGMLVRQKYKNHVFIPFEKAPKVAITTNYAINGTSNSFRRRMFEYEVSLTYSADYSPRDKFRHNFFDDWTAEQWNLFYNTMFQCLQVFLKNGLIDSEPISLNLTKLINKSCEEFVDWAENGIEPGIQYDKKKLYDSYVKAYPEYINRLKQRDFTYWLRAWGEYTKLIATESHSGEIRNIIFS